MLYANSHPSESVTSSCYNPIHGTGDKGIILPEQMPYAIATLEAAIVTIRTGRSWRTFL